MQESKQTTASWFEPFWMGAMFAFLWAYVLLVYNYFIPTYLQILAMQPHIIVPGLFGLISNGTRPLVGPIFWATVAGLLFMGWQKVGFAKDPDSGRRTLSLNRTPSALRKALMSLLIIAVMFLAMGLTSAWAQMFLLFMER